MTEARHAADGITTALQELGYKYGVSSVRGVLYDWKGKQDRVPERACSTLDGPACPAGPSRFFRRSSRPIANGLEST